MHVAIVGAGLIGRSWAMVFARAGWQRAAVRPESPAQLAARERASSRRASTSGAATDSSTIRRLRRRACRLQRSLERGREGADSCRRTCPRWSRSSARIFARARPARAARRDPRELHVGDPRVALHRRARRPRALPRRPSGQSAASRAGGRALRRAVDRRRDVERARAVIDASVGQVPIIVQARDRRLRPEPPAGRAADRGAAPRRRGLRVARRISTRRSRTASACAGRSWARSRRSSSTRRAASPIIARATPASIARSRPIRRRRPSGTTANVQRVASQLGDRRPTPDAIARDALARPAPAGAAPRTSATQPDSEHRGARPWPSRRKVIITCAVTGAIHTPSMSPHLPVTPRGDRRGRDRRGRGGRRDRAPARARSRRRQPDAGSRRRSRQFLPEIKQRSNVRASTSPPAARRR